MQAISTPLVEPALVLALLFVLVLVAPLAARAVRMPSIIGLIVAGIVIGPSALGCSSGRAPSRCWATPVCCI
jgi:Kef-type K+ transport system membrane component KefB